MSRDQLTPILIVISAVLSLSVVGCLKAAGNEPSDAAQRAGYTQTQTSDSSNQSDSSNSDSSTTDSAEKDLSYWDHTANPGLGYFIDKETGCQYIAGASPMSGITPRLDSTGRPMCSENSHDTTADKTDDPGN